MVDVLKRKSVSSRKNVQMLRFGEVDGCENTIITITAHVIVSLFSLSLSDTSDQYSWYIVQYTSGPCG
jgi:hypothetical protein